jgi:uncharacterized protein YecT (DUF1311 family)
MKLMIALLLISGAGSAYALDCKNAANTLEMNQCADIEQKQVEQKLNAVYQKTLKEFGGADDAGTKAALINAQRAWVKFREADCKAEYKKWEGGTIRSVMFSGCMQDRAQKRIKELEEFPQRG